MIRATTRLSVLAVLFFSASAAWAAGGSSATPPAAPPTDPLVEATRHYNTGVRHRNKAWDLETSLDEVEAGKREKTEKKIAKAWGNAERAYRDAIGLNDRFHEAWSDLGYVLRHTDRHESALEAYDRALALAPDYGPAIEYRGQAYLGLDRVDDAKQAYMALFGQDRALADDLMEAMQAWVEKRKADSGAVDPAVVSAFAAWIAEREQVASLVPSPQEQQARLW